MLAGLTVACVIINYSFISIPLLPNSSLSKPEKKFSLDDQFLRSWFFLRAANIMMLLDSLRTKLCFKTFNMTSFAMLVPIPGKGKGVGGFFLIIFTIFVV